MKEIGYCDMAMIKIGFKAIIEINELVDSAHKNIDKFGKE